MRTKTPKYIYAIFIACVGLYILFKFYLLLAQSLFITRPDRINIVLYGPQTYYYSLDRANNRHYAIAFQPDVKVDVPGGYGTYKVGSLGKLALLDKNPELLQKTFALTTTTFVHYIFYEENGEVYYGAQIPELKAPSIKKIMFSNSNASFLDRLYLAILLVDDNKDTYQPITFLEQKEEGFDDISFENELFFKDSIGLLFQETYRNEHKSIQVLYPKNYTTAARISALLEGNGIRVSDISYDIEQREHCNIIFSAKQPSQTAQDIGEYFGCNLSPGKTDVYDILFVLGQVEEAWRVK